MKKLSIVFVILILISLLATSVAFSQENEEAEEESNFKWVLKLDIGLNFALQQFYVFADGPDPENPYNNMRVGDSEGCLSWTLYSLFGDGHAIGFQMQFSPLYDFHYHLAYYKEFNFIDFIVPSVMATMGFNFVNGIDYPGFGFKGGGAITIIPNIEYLQIGFQLLLSWGYGRRSGSDSYEGRYLFQMPFSLFIKYLF
jgi:hypothetical protein